MQTPDRAERVGPGACERFGAGLLITRAAAEQRGDNADEEKLDGRIFFHSAKSVLWAAGVQRRTSSISQPLRLASGTQNSGRQRRCYSKLLRWLRRRFRPLRP